MLGSVSPQAHSRCFPPEFSTYLSHLISTVANLSSRRRNPDLQQQRRQTTATSERRPNKSESSQRADAADVPYL